MLSDINSLFYSWIRGGVFLLLLYHFVFYLKHKEKVYKYYSIYLLCISVFLLKDIVEFKNDLYKYLLFSIQFIAFSFYIHFSRELLNSKKVYPKWDRASKIISKVLLIIAFLLLGVQFFWGFEVQKEIILSTAPILSVVFIGGLAYIEIINTKEGVYSLIGSIILIAGANITALKAIKGDAFLFNIEVHNMFYFFVGVLIQNIVYAFLLADVLKKIEVEKSRAELDLHKKSSQLYELKMTAFKNKMNPHFLFNSLNSINNFVIQNKKEEASIYIAKFSSLIRKVLQTTEKVYISLAEELRISELYINIELLRFRNSFVYEIIIDKNIEVEQIKVVPLYLQPFVENAIWHGLSLKKGKKKLTIKVESQEGFVITRVIDNGVGFDQSIYQKKTQELKHKPFGINTVKNRLDLIYNPQNVSIKVNETKNVGKNESGTEVAIIFPNEKN